MIKVHTIIQRIEGNNRRTRDVTGNENVKLPAFPYRHTIAAYMCTSILPFPAFRTKKGNDRSKYEMMPYRILLVFYFRFVDLHCRGTAPEKRFGFLC